MNAQYFYKRLLRYSIESSTSGKYYYGYSNSSVQIHRKNNNSEWYSVFVGGSVTKENIDGDIIRGLNISDLLGDDFEIFNIVQIVKSGYLVIEKDDTRITNMRVIISKLHKYIQSFETPWWSSEVKLNIPHLCGGSTWTNGSTDYFMYSGINGIEVHVETIKHLCDENIQRKYYDVRPIPFIKSIDSSSAIHIRFVYSMYKPDRAGIQKRCNEALQELIGYMNDIGIKCEWIERKTKYPVYL